MKKRKITKDLCQWFLFWWHNPRLKVATEKTWSRFYSKFHKKKMTELTDMGLQNFISLFLTLANCVETEGIVQKLCSFLGLIPSNNKSQSMSLIIIKGLYAMYHLQRKLKLTTPVLTATLRSDFEHICRIFVERHFDQTNRRNYWQFIALHFDCLEDLFENDRSCGDESFLEIGHPLSAVFNNSNDTEARRVCSFVYRLLSNASKLQRNDTALSELERFVWSGIYSWMEKSFLDKQLLQRIPESLADPAAGFSLLSVSSFKEPNLVPDFNELVNKSTSSDLPVRFTTQYLNHLLSNSTALEKIISDNHQCLIVRAWLRCLVFLTEKHPQIVELTRAIALLPEIKDLIEKEPKANENVPFSIIISFGRMQASTTQLAEMVQLRQKADAYFSSILEGTDSILQAGNPPDSLRLLYSITAKLVKNCSKLIYSKTSPDCLLPKILDQLVLPRLGSKKIVPASVTQCILGHLHQFLSGITSLDFKKDVFVKRKLKEIFSRYFLMITKRCNASPSSKNPFLVALQNSFNPTPTQQESDFRQFVVEIIADNFLVLPQPPENYSAVLFFILKLFQSSNGSSQIIRNSPTVIIQIMCSLISCDACGGGTSEPPGIRKPVMEILTFVTKAYKTASNEHRKKLQEQLQNVLLLNVPQFQGIVFKSFESLARLDRNLCQNLVGTARKSVEENEKTRGCGEDKRLRSALESFIAATR